MRGILAPSLVVGNLLGFRCSFRRDDAQLEVVISKLDTKEQEERTRSPFLRRKSFTKRKVRKFVLRHFSHGHSDWWKNEISADVYHLP